MSAMRYCRLIRQQEDILKLFLFADCWEIGLNLNQQIYNALVSGSLVVAKESDSYAILPKALADRINDKMEGFIIVNNSEKNEQITDEEDPYAAYVIPDDLMW